MERRFTKEGMLEATTSLWESTARCMSIAKAWDFIYAPKTLVQVWRKLSQDMSPEEQFGKPQASRQTT